MIRTRRRDQNRQLRLRRRAGAVVLNGSYDAKVILPLWNALCGVEPDPDFHFELFEEIEPALEWLGIPAAHGASVIERVRHAA